MITKFKKDEILFYLSYIILYVSLFIGDVYNIGSMDILARYLRIGSYTLIFISCINLRLKKKDFFRMFAVLMVDIAVWCENRRFILEHFNLTYL